MNPGLMLVCVVYALAGGVLTTVAIVKKAARGYGHSFDVSYW